MLYALAFAMACVPVAVLLMLARIIACRAWSPKGTYASRSEVRGWLVAIRGVHRRMWQ